MFVRSLRRAEKSVRLFFCEKGFSKNVQSDILYRVLVFGRLYMQKVKIFYNKVDEAVKNECRKRGVKHIRLDTGLDEKIVLRWQRILWSVQLVQRLGEEERAGK